MCIPRPENRSARTCDKCLTQMSTIEREIIVARRDLPIPLIQKVNSFESNEKKYDLDEHETHERFINEIINFRKKLISKKLTFYAIKESFFLRIPSNFL